MFRQFFSGMEWTFLPLFSLAVFAGVFSVLVLRVLVIQKPSDLDALAGLPLREGTPVNSEVKS